MLSVCTSQDNPSHKRAEAIREKDQRDAASFTACVDAATRRGRMDLDSSSNWTMDDYGQKYSGVMDVKCLDVKAVDSRNLVVYDRSRFERDITLGAWKRS